MLSLPQALSALALAVLLPAAPVLAGGPAQKCGSCGCHRDDHKSRRAQRLQSRSANEIFDSRVPIIPLVDSVPLVSSPVVVTNAQVSARGVGLTGRSGQIVATDRLTRLEERVTDLETNLQKLTDNVFLIKGLLEKHIENTAAHNQSAGE